MGVSGTFGFEENRSPSSLNSTALDHVVEFKLLKNQEILFVAWYVWLIFSYSILPTKYFNIDKIINKWWFSLTGARSKKLIPVLIESGIQVPQVLRHVTLCDYTKQDLKDWFWDRLSKAIKAPLDPQNSGSVPPHLSQGQGKNENK